MGTRCTTKMIDADGQAFISLYRQYDGYPEGHGKELAKFLVGIQRVGSKLGAGTANGIHCLAAQVVAHFKTEPGEFYLVPAGQTEQWDYIVSENPNGDWLMRVIDGGDDEVDDYFFGTPAGFLKLLEDSEKEDKA